MALDAKNKEQKSRFAAMSNERKNLPAIGLPLLVFWPVGLSPETVLSLETLALDPRLAQTG
jgi:hypothetical protein